MELFAKIDPRPLIPTTDPSPNRTLAEDVARSGHVVHGPGIQIPEPCFSSALAVELCEDLLCHQMDASRRRQRGAKKRDEPSSSSACVMWASALGLRWAVMGPIPILRPLLDDDSEPPSFFPAPLPRRPRGRRLACAPLLLPPPSCSHCLNQACHSSGSSSSAARSSVARSVTFAKSAVTSMATTTVESLLGATQRSFSTTLLSGMTSLTVLNDATRFEMRKTKSSTDSPDLNQIDSNSRQSSCAFIFLTASLPIRMDSIAFHGSAVDSFTTRDATIDRVSASRARRSSYRLTPPSSMASQRFLACILDFMSIGQLAKPPISGMMRTSPPLLPPAPSPPLGTRLPGDHGGVFCPSLSGSQGHDSSGAALSALMPNVANPGEPKPPAINLSLTDEHKETKGNATPEDVLRTNAACVKLPTDSLNHDVDRELGSFVSSLQCPCLEKLTSDSLKWLRFHMENTHTLAVAAPVLLEIHVSKAIEAHIAAPKLAEVRLGDDDTDQYEWRHLQRLVLNL
ncbi:hypothetical protein HU200_050624 [Digitaria exilis]|uniref:Uncharacterized protein n=1 Tax=Digitaria exilis TaxID=1010633 RepID=A0A835AMW3_9POAL|nr:hypothetical protein HU200_050624 [Digitaria exilis]